MHKQGSIIKENTGAWIWVFFSIAIIMFIAALLFFILTRDVSTRPDWAPEGCTVTESTRRGNTVIINVNDIENFDTEQELAALILLTLDNKADFYNQPSNYVVTRGVEIQFPMNDLREMPVVQYQEVHHHGESRDALMVRINDQRIYHREPITLDELRQCADGELRLGLLDDADWLYWGEE